MTAPTKTSRSARRTPPRSVVVSAGGLCLLALGAGQVAASLVPGRSDGAAETPRTASVKQGLARAYGGLPLRFEPNRGQTDRRVSFLARAPGYGLFLTQRGAVLSLPGIGAGGPVNATHGPAGGVRIRMQFVGANRRPQLTAARRLPGVSNYFTGGRPAMWRTGVPAYARVRYRQVYAGIDVVYYGRGGGLEYDFVLRPGASPEAIVMRFRGARGVNLDRGGDLLVHTAAGTLRQKRPVAYQVVAGTRRVVESRYRVARDGTVRLRVGAYDHSRSLVIDPALVYSTYLGGEQEGTYQLIRDIAVDSSGSAHVVGVTDSPDFPTKDGLSGSSGGGRHDAFVTKLAPNGRTLVYSTYLGGTSTEEGYGVALDAAGSVYVTGTTGSRDFTTTPGSLRSCASSAASEAFVTKIAAGGSALAYSTCLGGVANEVAHDIAVDSSGRAYVAGATNSPDFPTRNARQPTFVGAPSVFGCQLCDDAFVARLNIAGSGLEYSTFLGGSGEDRGLGIAVGGSRAYVIGRTCSSDFPTAQPLQPSNAGGCDAFVSKLDTGASGSASLPYSTYLGGGGEELRVVASGAATAAGIALDPAAPSDAVHVAGGTCSDNFPVARPLQRESAGECDAFAAKLRADGSPLDYSTYLGGSGFDSANGVAVEKGAAHLVGETRSEDLPTVRPVAPRALGRDAFAAKLAPDGSSLAYSSYLGGRGADSALAVALDASGPYLAGQTDSDDFPTLSAFQPEPASTVPGRSKGFVAKLGPLPPGGPLVTAVAPTSGPTSGGTTVTLTGHDFRDVSDVSFGGIPAASYTIESDSRITAVSPAHEAATVAVRVATPAGISPGNPVAWFTYGEGRWRATGSLRDSRAGHTATLLPNGRVLVAGGAVGREDRFVALASAELYDPLSGMWSDAGSLAKARMGHSATLLEDGKVLVAGAEDGDRSTELYDPSAGTWNDAGGDLTTTRDDSHSATRLEDGRVLVTGTLFGDRGSAEVYDPASGAWTATEPTEHVHAFPHASVLLRDGKVLVVGGCYRNPDIGADLECAELYDPATGRWADTTDPANGVEREHTATLLPSGKLVLAGGRIQDGGWPFNSSEVYDPQSSSWTGTGFLTTGRHGHGATLLPNGKVLVLGGEGAGALQSAEVYDPARRRWDSAGFMSIARGSVPTVRVGPGGSPTATVLSSAPDTFEADPAVCGKSCGKVLITGGASVEFPGPSESTDTAELYTPAPSIVAIAPATGPAAGGTEVTVEGTGFTHDPVDVKFGGTSVPCPSAACVVDSYSKLRVRSPSSQTNQSVRPVVRNEGGQAQSSAPFIYTGASAGGGGGPGGGNPGGGGAGTVPGTGAPQRAGTGLLGDLGGALSRSERRRARRLRSCLARAGRRSHDRRRSARRGSLVERAIATGRARRWRASLRRRCLRRHGRTPGRVTGLSARSLSRSRVELEFRAPGTNRAKPPPARTFLLKQSTRPIRGRRGFRRARALCGGSCRVNPARIGDRITITITDLRPDTTYYYAVAARDNVSGRLGPRSRVVKVRTR